MTLQIATSQYFCVCFVQLSLHLLLLLLLLLISTCDSLSLFVSLPHYTLDWLFLAPSIRVDSCHKFFWAHLFRQRIRQHAVRVHPSADVRGVTPLG